MLEGLLQEEGKLKPGMIIGIYYPKSNWNGKTEKCYTTEVTVFYTHNLLYLGENNKGKMVFAENFYSNGPSIRTLEQFKDHGLIAMAVISAPDKLNKEKEPEKLVEEDHEIYDLNEIDF